VKGKLAKFNQMCEKKIMKENFHSPSIDFSKAMNKENIVKGHDG
jgi:hypothetical protein